MDDRELRGCALGKAGGGRGLAVGIGLLPREHADGRAGGWDRDPAERTPDGPWAAIRSSREAAGRPAQAAKGGEVMGFHMA